MDPAFRYTWLIWATAFMAPWTVLFIVRPALRKPMLRASALTVPFGLTEPLFVPAYWNPPSLFDLAQRTGFDIESLIFCFALGGLGVAGYRALVPVTLRPMGHRSAFFVAASVAPPRAGESVRRPPRAVRMALESNLSRYRRDACRRCRDPDVSARPLAQRRLRWGRVPLPVHGFSPGIEMDLARVHRGGLESR